MTWLIARYTFLHIVRSKSFLLAVFGLPMLAAIWIGLSVLLGVLVAGSLKQKFTTPVAILDLSGVLSGNPNLLGGLSPGARRSLDVPVHKEKKRRMKRTKQEIEERGRTSYFSNSRGVEESKQAPGNEDYLKKLPVVVVQSKEQGRELLGRGEIELFVVLPGDFEQTGKYLTYSKRNRSAANPSSRLALIMKNEILSRAGLNESMRQAILFDFESVSQEYSEDGSELRQEAVDRNFFYAMLLAVAFVLPMAGASSYGLSSSLSDESESKLTDVFLSCVSARELLLGKVLGAAASDVITILVWSSLALTFAALGVGGDERLVFLLDKPQILWCVPFAVLGVFQYQLFGAFLGSISTDSSKNKFVQWLARLLSVVPIAAVVFSIFDPDSAGVGIVTFIPPISPAIILPRLIISDVNQWEILLALLVNLGFVFAASMVFARVYRAIVLLRGRALRPSRVLEFVLDQRA